jgi:glycosyltransferase involved in cell wall biosynthesis
MYPSEHDRVRGSFVRDQVEALRRLPDTEVEVFAFASAGPRSYFEAGRQVHRRFRGERFDVVHAHFGLTLWPSLAARGAPHAVTLHGTDLVHPRSRAITLAGLPWAELVAPVSESLRDLVPARAVRGSLEVLPCGADMRRFRRLERASARAELGLSQSQPYLLFPADPTRPEKRVDRARAVAGPATLLTLGDVAPEQVPLWVNAANAVLVTSERESFGLATIEALACDVPVLSTPVGVAPEVLQGIDGAHCGPFDPPVWRAALEPLLAESDPRVAGRAAAERYSADRMAERVRAAWRRMAGGGTG